MLETCRGV